MTKLRISVRLSDKEKKIISTSESQTEQKMELIDALAMFILKTTSEKVA